MLEQEEKQILIAKRLLLSDQNLFGRKALNSGETETKSDDNNDNDNDDKNESYGKYKNSFGNPTGSHHDGFPNDKIPKARGPIKPRLLLN